MGSVILGIAFRIAEEKYKERRAARLNVETKKLERRQYVEGLGFLRIKTKSYASEQYGYSEYGRTVVDTEDLAGKKLRMEIYVPSRLYDFEVNDVVKFTVGSDDRIIPSTIQGRELVV
jgi:hypothetical protein